jgi:hypothetical protein
MLALLYIYIYINSTNISQIMIINRIYEHQAVACSLPDRAKDLSGPYIVVVVIIIISFLQLFNHFLSEISF